MYEKNFTPLNMFRYLTSLLLLFTYYLGIDFFPIYLIDTIT